MFTVDKVRARVAWSDLVLPAPHLAKLRDIVDRRRLAKRVGEEWGFDRGGGKAQGVTALFSGPSGTGKTLAAEAIAAEQNVDLYRVDLALVVSKYIGETEKNLGKLFDAVEDREAVLLFDEADALFGKRTNVKDSNDRYANIEVTYLLQRLERFRGVAILTVTDKAAIDAVVLRRIRFVIDFPRPGPDDRRLLWERAIPVQAPTAPLDFGKLARHALTGGQIREAALDAACQAARDEVAISMAHLEAAAKGQLRPS
jgi:SpoVK/Ycf46/Vps4 family AAA+-type ATPase